jgi:hypothetical protein
MLERPSESHNGGKTTGFFPRELRSLLNVVDYHNEPLYIGMKTPLCNRGYKWEVHVVLYENTKGTGEHRVSHVHHASAPTTTFEEGIHDVAHQTLIVLHHQESAILERARYHHFLSKETDNSEVHVNDNVRDDPTRHLEEHVCLTMATDHALSEAMHEIEELHMHYDEQEQVIKDHDDFIGELLDEI